MRTFQDLAISFSIICILSGGINSFPQGIASVGGVALTLLAWCRRTACRGCGRSRTTATPPSARSFSTCPMRCDVGAAFPVMAVLCVVGTLVLLYIGTRPPDDQALTVTAGVVVLAVAVWFADERRQFAGPPVGRIGESRLAKIAAERAVGEG